jgi:hypothetical protein
VVISLGDLGAILESCPNFRVDAGRTSTRL